MSVEPETLYMKRGSVRKVRMKLTDSTGAAIPLGAATGNPRFQMRTLVGSTLKVDREGVVIDAANGIVEYSPTTADVDTPGRYWVEWRVPFAGGDIVVPEKGYLPAVVGDDLAPNS